MTSMLADRRRQPSHRRTSAGPVTVAIRVAKAPYPRPVALALRLWPALPAAGLIRAALAGNPRLPGYAANVLGTDAVLCLIACLTISPLLTVAPVRVTALRWWYGVWMFVLGAAGLGIALTVDQPGGILMRASGNSVNWTGLAVVVLLVPAAVTSNRFCQRVLGAEWKRWQRGLVWAVWWFVLGHLIVMSAWVFALAYLTVTVPLLALRRRSFRRKVKEWRSGGYSTGGMWIALDVLALVYLAGLAALLAEEAVAVARAASLSP